jgi:hypothetical protein
MQPAHLLKKKLCIHFKYFLIGRVEKNEDFFIIDDKEKRGHRHRRQEKTKLMSMVFL